MRQQGINACLPASLFCSSNQRRSNRNIPKQTDNRTSTIISWGAEGPLRTPRDNGKGSAGTVEERQVGKRRKKERQRQAEAGREAEEKRQRTEVKAEKAEKKRGRGEERQMRSAPNNI